MSLKSSKKIFILAISWLSSFCLDCCNLWRLIAINRYFDIVVYIFSLRRSFGLKFEECRS